MEFFLVFFFREKSSFYPLSAKLKVSLLLPVDVRLVFWSSGSFEERDSFLFGLEKRSDEERLYFYCSSSFDERDSFFRVRKDVSRLFIQESTAHLVASDTVVVAQDKTKSQRFQLTKPFWRWLKFFISRADEQECFCLFLFERKTFTQEAEDKLSHWVSIVFFR